MKKYVSIIMLLMLTVTGCNLAIGLFDSLGPGVDDSSLPADITIYYNNQFIYNESNVNTIGNAIVGDEKDIDFIINNTGDENLLLFGNPGIFIEGYGFSVIREPDSIIPPGTQSHFTLSFTPSRAMQYNAVVSIVSNDEDRSPFQFTMSGIGVEVPEPFFVLRLGNSVVLPGDRIDLGSFKVNNEKKEVFHIRNMGTEVLILEGIPAVRISGDGFTLLKDALSPLAPGDGVTFQLAFSPPGVGEFGGIVVIEGNDPHVPEFVFSIVGHGIE